MYAAPAPPVEYIASAQSVSYAAPALVLCTLCQRLYPMPAPIVTATGGFGSFPVEPTVYTGTCGGIHRDGTISVYVTLVLVVDYIAPAPSGYAAPALPVDVHRVSTISVLRRTFTGTVYFVHSACILCTQQCIATAE